MTQTKFKRLFLDIETSPCIVYSWGTGYNLTLPHDNIITERAIICACWKWEGERGVYSATWNSRHDDESLLRTLLVPLSNADEIVAHNGCLTPGHRVLTADLRWVPVETLQEGDKLLTCQEHSNKHHPRRWAVSEVVQNLLVPQECYRLYLSDGRILEASSLHPFLSRGRWLTVQDIARNLEHTRYANHGVPLDMLITPWEEDNTWDAGYLAGFFDGEGCVCQATNKGAISPHYALSVNATQRDNEALAATTAALHRCKVRHSVVAYDNQHVAMRRISILGTATDKLRFLGRFRPARLLANLDPLRLGALRNTPSQYSGKKHTHYRQTVHVVRAVPIGMQTVCGLETTSKTYIAEGFGCHNSHFDLPWIRTRALKHGIPCNWNFKVFDTLVEARRRLYLNSNSLDYISKFLDRKGKTKTDFSWWIDVMNDKPGALDRMVRYCKRDVRELEAVFHRISTHLGHKTHRGVQEGGSKWQCPLCGSAKVSPHKPRTTAAGTIQHQMQCNRCHKYYTISVASYEKMLEERTT